MKEGTKVSWRPSVSRHWSNPGARRVQETKTSKHVVV